MSVLSFRLPSFPGMDWREVRVDPGEVIRFHGSPVTVISATVSQDDGWIEMTVEGDLPAPALAWIQRSSLKGVAVS